MTSGNKIFLATCIPKVLIPYILDQAHSALGHNGIQQTYKFIRRLYFWPKMQKDIKKFISKYLPCQQTNARPQIYPSQQLLIPKMPMQMLSMDLIGPFPNVTPQGNRYALIAIDMLTGFAFCIPIANREANTVIKAFQQKFFSSFGGTQVILTDNGSEFKNTLFAQVAQELGIKWIFTSPYHPQGNSKVESFHKFLKNCI